MSCPGKPTFQKLKYASIPELSMFLLSQIVYNVEIHCVWKEWEEGECSVTCGIGTKMNTRTKLVVEANGGTCSGQSTEIKECKSDDCPGESAI